jgi:mRNA-degrading endonuclease toxin of MazEF toxin-antitoxin module
VKRGEIWTLRDEGFASKARPVVIVQDDVTVCREELGAFVGTLTDSQMSAVSRGLAAMLHITGSDV